MCVLLGGGVPTIKGKVRVLPCLPLSPGAGGGGPGDSYQFGDLGVGILRAGQG